jgi:hypothetical protein
VGEASNECNGARQRGTRGRGRCGYEIVEKLRPVGKRPRDGFAHRNAASRKTRELIQALIEAHRKWLAKTRVKTCGYRRSSDQGGRAPHDVGFVAMRMKQDRPGGPQRPDQVLKASIEQLVAEAHGAEPPGPCGKRMPVPKYDLACKPETLELDAQILGMTLDPAEALAIEKQPNCVVAHAASSQKRVR